VSLIAKLLREIPAAEKYRAELEAMEQENARLRAENAGLGDDLAQALQDWQTLDHDAVRTLEHLARFERGEPQEIAGANRINIQIVESYLAFLAREQYVVPPRNGEPYYGITHKGRRYLRVRGLPKDDRSE